ncbi:aminoacyl-tRNA hydrolase [Candidatus Nesciobacter abundans]|uniref:Peptidyl-tRNA hydrolase n=1 Tax=Candidatus Nesciobacter abundans TaxID=2601668 RepID=A0A5C0UIK1_9PROT|nr:aminoacyl-tRNA hydrolase [Candidatus Nesciobacter abundans]QEK39252.1 peptidyl-tRNA hydrolase [Candidatus Nesciobacter abundans]
MLKLNEIINLKDYKCLVGLGNIGKEYASTRHNLGFVFLDVMKEKFYSSDFKSNRNYSISSLEITINEVHENIAQEKNSISSEPKSIKNNFTKNSDQNNFPKVQKKHHIDFIKPSTYMNSSGLAVLSYMKNKNVKPEEVLVVHDDLETDEYEIKIKHGGGTAGHKGLKSITSAIGSEYSRVKVGIGHPGHGVAEFVLKAIKMDKWNIAIERWIDSNIKLD